MSSNVLLMGNWVGSFLPHFQFPLGNTLEDRLVREWNHEKASNVARLGQWIQNPVITLSFEKQLACDGERTCNITNPGGLLPSCADPYVSDYAIVNYQCIPGKGTNSYRLYVIYVCDSAVVCIMDITNPVAFVPFVQTLMYPTTVLSTISVFQVRNQLY